jgi:DNA-binding MarR family transcriptional regulator
VLVVVARHPDIRITEIAELVGITERATHRILMELVEEGYLSVSKKGRRNVYAIQAELPLRRPVFRDIAIRNLLDALISKSPFLAIND